MSIEMPVNPHTGLYNVTEGEFLDAVAATEDIPLTRPDGTLTRAGQVYVADVRTRGHDDCDTCHPGLYDPAPEGWDEYARACDAQYAADPTHAPATSNDAECDLCGRAVHIAPYSGELAHGYDPTMGE